MFNRFLITFCILFSDTSLAEIYQWIDDAGNTHYSDQAPKNKPDLQARDIPIPTAMPAIKIAPKKKENSGPTLIDLNSERSKPECSTASSGIGNPTGKYENALETYNWKNCHGMR